VQALAQRPSCDCEVRNAANAVPAASARGSRARFVCALSDSRPEKIRDRTMFRPHTSSSFVNLVWGENLRSNLNASSSSTR